MREIYGFTPCRLVWHWRRCLADPVLKVPARERGSLPTSSNSQSSRSRNRGFVQSTSAMREVGRGIGICVPSQVGRTPEFVFRRAPVTDAESGSASARAAAASAFPDSDDAGAQRQRVPAASLVRAHDTPVDSLAHEIGRLGLRLSGGREPAGREDRTARGRKPRRELLRRRGQQGASSLHAVETQLRQPRRPIVQHRTALARAACIGSHCKAWSRLHLAVARLHPGIWILLDHARFFDIVVTIRRESGNPLRNTAGPFDFDRQGVP